MKNKFLSLEWFKNKVEISVEKVISSRLDKIIDNIDKEESIKDIDVNYHYVEKPYKNVKLVNDTVTIVMQDGSIISKSNFSPEEFNEIKFCNTEDELLALVTDPTILAEKEERKKEVIKAKALQKGIQILGELNDFEVKDNVVYLVGTSRSIPQLLVEKFLEVVYTNSNKLDMPWEIQKKLNNDAEYLSLKRFFMWCCLNPRAEVADELYRFLNENSFRITKQGFFVALRNVVTLHGSPELVHFISNTYNKVKAVWKKSPDDYTVFLENGEYKLVHEDKLYKEETYTSTYCEACDGEGFYYDWDEEEIECEECNGTGEVEEYEYTERTKIDHGKEIGNLTELYLDLPNRDENRFTDDWTKTFDIRVGKVTNMPQEDCNWSTQDCAAAGLHFTADQIHYVGCGDQSVLVLINPMKVVGIGKHKGRCYEYLPIMTVPREEATSILHDGMFDTLELDEHYAIRELESLTEKVKKGFTIESSKHEFNLPSISSDELNDIVLSLNEMKQELNNRVSIID